MSPQHSTQPSPLTPQVLYPPVVSGVTAAKNPDEGGTDSGLSSPDDSVANGVAAGVVAVSVTLLPELSADLVAVPSVGTATVGESVTYRFVSGMLASEPQTVTSSNIVNAMHMLNAKTNLVTGHFIQFNSVRSHPAWLAKTVNER